MALFPSDPWRCDAAELAGAAKAVCLLHRPIRAENWSSEPVCSVGAGSDRVYENCYIAATIKIKGSTAGFTIRPIALH